MQNLDKSAQNLAINPGIHGLETADSNDVSESRFTSFFSGRMSDLKLQVLQPGPWDIPFSRNPGLATIALRGTRGSNDW